jgi:hypothetical protein
MFQIPAIYVCPFLLHFKIDFVAKACVYFASLEDKEKILQHPEDKIKNLNPKTFAGVIDVRRTNTLYGNM